MADAVRLAPAGAASPQESSPWWDVMHRVHRAVLEEVELERLDALERADAEAAVRELAVRLVEEDGTPLNRAESEAAVDHVLYEVFGFGPLEPLLGDPEVSDILVNTHDEVWIERNGRLERTGVRFRDREHLLAVIDRIVSAVGRRVDDASPMVDARLPDGSRVNAVIPPLAVDGPLLSIRKFRRDVLSAEDLLRNGTLPAEMLRVLQACVRARLNILISGGTGAGKTTLLNALSGSIPTSERIVTIEDSAELQLRQPHVVRLETRPAGVEGTGRVTQRELVVNALRMRPDRIIVGEARGVEAVDMLQAMNTGHDGSLTTVHANTPRDALTRLEAMVSMAGLDLPDRAARRQIAGALDLLVHMARLEDGRRRVIEVSELVGVRDGEIGVESLFVFERERVTEDGLVVGRFRRTRPTVPQPNRLRSYGIDVAGLAGDGGSPGSSEASEPSGTG